MKTDPAIVEIQSTPTASTSNLKLRLRKHLQFPSRLTREKHDLIVYLPPLYDTEPVRNYPVLFMQDGQNLFDPETSFIKGNYWRMGETADELIAADEIEPSAAMSLLVVANQVSAELVAAGQTSAAEIRRVLGVSQSPYDPP